MTPTRKEAVTQLKIIANYIARKSPNDSETLRGIAALIEVEGDLVDAAHALCDHVVFGRDGGLELAPGAARIFADYFFAYVAAEVARRAIQSPIDARSD